MLLLKTLLICEIINIICSTTIDKRLAIKGIRILLSTSILPGNRDGILIATLETGEDTTICGYNFNEIDAGVACKTLGYPNKAYALISQTTVPAPFNAMPVLLGDFNCTGNESTLMYCVNSGRKVFDKECGQHKMDVHIYCLENKIEPDKTTNVVCTKSKGTTAIEPLAGKINSGVLRLDAAYVCNDDFSQTTNYLAIFYCKTLCNYTLASDADSAASLLFNIPNNYVAGTNSYVRPECTSPSHCQVPTGSAKTYPPCDKSSIVGIKCAEEPQKIEPGPNVMCTNVSMTVSWVKSHDPYIDAKLISTTQCQMSIIDDGINSSSGLKIQIWLNSTIKYEDTNTIYYSCELKRSYNGTNTYSKTLLVRCKLPKSSNDSESLKFVSATPRSLLNSYPVSSNLNFYTDQTFQVAITNFKDNPIDNSKNVFVKVNLLNNTYDSVLRLKDCVVSDTPKLYTTNEIFLIKDGCPIVDYEVEIIQQMRQSIGFKFSPLKLSGKFPSAYVVCKSQACHSIGEGAPHCQKCQSTSNKRKKRSPLLYISSSHLIYGQLK